MTSRPERTCVGCRQRSPKAEMIRVVSDGAGGITFDRAQTLPGRGAYFHHGCEERGFRKKILSHALRTVVDVEPVRAIRELCQSGRIG